MRYTSPIFGVGRKSRMSKKRDAETEMKQR